MHGVSLRKPCERCHPSERPASTLDQLAVQPAATMSGPERVREMTTAELHNESIPRAGETK